MHELAHHVQCCFEGKTGHDRGFYTIYKHLLETAHQLGFIDLAETTDQIDSRDLANMAKLVGPPSRPTPIPKASSHIIKVSNAFAIKDDLKAHGYVFSSTEKAWIHEVEDALLSSEAEWISARAQPDQIRIVKRSENVIESVYFCIVGKSGVFQHIEELKADGYRFDSKAGWYKRIPAIEKTTYEREVVKKFSVTPRFRGKL
ncbi:hypothetical protein BJL96_27845 [Burkholderia cenocepacia]|nr:hypothetical protein [Burkholderia cenocepacia]